MVIAKGATLENDIFHIVFLISLFSVALQGSLLPAVARKLHMVDYDNDVRKTFNDYQEETAITLMQMNIIKSLRIRRIISYSDMGLGINLQCNLR